MSWVWCVWGHLWASRHGMTQRLSHGPSTSNLHLHKDKGWISELFIHVRPCMQTWGLGHFTPGGNWTINGMWNSVSLLWCLDSTGCLWSLGREEGRGRTEFGSKKCQDRGETSVEAKPSLSCGWVGNTKGAGEGPAVPCQTEAKCSTEPHHGSWMLPHSVCFPFQSSAGGAHYLLLRRLHETPNRLQILSV